MSPTQTKFSRVVVHYLDGRCLRGYTVDFDPLRDDFHLGPSEICSNAVCSLVRIAELKAVYFVKSLATTSHTGSVTLDANFKVEPGMRRVIVKFKDGELLLGTTCGWSPERKGFFMQPLDPTTNNERIFVVQASTEIVRMLLHTESMSRVLSEMGITPSGRAHA